MEKITRAGSLFLAMSHCLLVHFRRTLHAVQSPRPIRLVRALIQHRHRSPNLGPTPSQHAAHTQPPETGPPTDSKPAPAAQPATGPRRGHKCLNAVPARLGPHARLNRRIRRPVRSSRPHPFRSAPPGLPSLRRDTRDTGPTSRHGAVQCAQRAQPRPDFRLGGAAAHVGPALPSEKCRLPRPNLPVPRGPLATLHLACLEPFWPVAFWSECSCARTLSTHLSPHHPIFQATMARTGSRILPLAVVALHTSGYCSALAPRPSSLPPRWDSPLSPHKSGRRH